MANELDITGTIRYRKNGVKADLSLNSRVNVTGDKITEMVQEVANTETVLDKGNVTNMGYAIIENLDDTSSVLVRAIQNNASSNLLLIAPGEFAGPMRFNLDTVYVITNTGTATIRTIIVED